MIQWSLDLASAIEDGGEPGWDKGCGEVGEISAFGWLGCG